MPLSAHSPPRARFASAAAAASIQALIAVALIIGLAAHGEEPAAQPNAVSAISIDPPAPPPPPPPRASEAEEGGASPPDRLADPAPREAPEPAVRVLPSPTPASADRTGSGAAPDAGSAQTAGPGSGAGGIGDGAGSGGSGSGTGAGSGTGGRGAQRVSGSLRDSDYPDAAARVRASGTVFVRFTVTLDGRARGCAVTRSSGNPALDDTTCRLIESRFRYRPATDASGSARESVVETNFTWGPR